MPNQKTRFNRVKYTLYSDILNPLLIQEPNGWNDDEKELKRSDKYFGVMTNLSNNLAFYKDAFDYIYDNYKQRGIKANVRLEKEERNSLTDRWELSYTGYLDFSTYSKNKNYIRIKFNESQFFKNIESRMKDKYELERLTDLKGNVLPALTYKDLTLQGRDIFRETSFDNEDEIVKIKYKGSSTFDALVDIAIPLKMKYRSDESFFAPAVTINSGGYLDLATAQIGRGFGEAVYNAGTLYYLSAENAKTININVRLKFRAKFASPENGDSATFKIFDDIVEGNPDDGYFSTTETQIMQCVGATSSPSTPPFYTIGYNTWKDFDITYNVNKNLLEGQSLGLRINPFFSPNPYNRTNVWDFEFETIEVLAQEVDLGETTNCKTLRMFDVCDRLLQIITGKQCFQSDLLNNEWRDLLLTNGFKIRNFTDKNITISLDEAIDAMMAIDDIALFIQDGTVRIEKKSKAFEDTVSIDLGVVSNINRKIADQLHYSSVEIGYDFDGEYLEVNGLDEFNIKSTYSTCIDTNGDKPFKAISKVRADAYGITLAQTKQIVNFPKLDTAYDKYNFFFDALLVSGNSYVVRHWETDFTTAPTGIFSPDTAFNLRLSPFNSLLRKSKTISTGLQKFPNERLVYSSTEGNSQLVTLYPERADVLNSILSSPYFLPEEIDFEKKISMQQFKTIVQNPHKLLKFTNEEGKSEYAYIYPSVKPNKKGKFLTIKANF